MERRDFLKRGGLALSAAALAAAPAPLRGAAAPARASAAVRTAPGAVARDPKDWAWVRSQFDLLDPGWAHFDGFFLTSHPKPVREAIDRYRAALDKNPMAGLHELAGGGTDGVRAAAAEYCGVAQDDIALTDSTT